MVKISSTFDKEMKNASFRKEFNKAYKEFLLSEIMSALMENDRKSVRKLAKVTVIQKTDLGNKMM